MKKNLYLIPLFIFIIFNTSAQQYFRPNVQCPNNIEINPYLGSVFTTRSDVNIPGYAFPLSVSFNYNSGYNNQNWGFGKGWLMSLTMYYLHEANGHISIFRPDGRKDFFSKDSAGAFHHPVGVYDTLVEYQTGNFLITTKTGIRYFFDGINHGGVTRVEDRNGNFLSMTYAGIYLTQVTDQSGRSIQLAYSNNLLASITDANGSPSRVWTYLYDANSNLKEVADPSGKKTRYSSTPDGLLNAVISGNGNVVSISYYPDTIRKFEKGNAQNYTNIRSFDISKRVERVMSSYTNHNLIYDLKNHKTRVEQAAASGSITTELTFDNNGNLKSRNGNCCGPDMQFVCDGNNNITQITDGLGLIYHFVYDSKGNVISVTDPANQVIQISYDSLSQPAAYTGKSGAHYTISRDGNGNILQLNMPGGISNSFTYNSAGQVAAMTDGNANVTSVTYNSWGFPAAITLPGSVTKQFAFNARGELLSYTNPNNKTTSLLYDNLSRLLKMTDPAGNSVSITLDPEGNPVSITDKNNHKTRFAYDRMNRLTSVIDPKNQVVQYAWDQQSNLVSVTDKNSFITRLEYNQRNKPVRVIYPTGEQIVYAYDANDNMLDMQFPNGGYRNYTYDLLNRIIEIADQDGLLRTFTYNALDKIITSANALGNTWTNSYDSLGRLISITDPYNKNVTYSYDANNNLLSKTDRNNHTKTYQYDALDRLNSVSDYLGHIVNFSYDNAGNLLSLNAPSGQATTFIYDDLNRLLERHFPDGSTQVMTRYPNGKIKSYKDRANQLTSFIYDDLDQILKTDFPGVNDNIYSYDASGQLISAANSDALVTFAYDPIGRKKTETLNGKKTKYNYNPANSQVQVLYPGGKIVTKIYDKRNKLKEVRDGNTLLASFNYDNASRLSSCSYPVTGKSISYAFDNKNRMTSMSCGPGNIAGFNYTYDFKINKQTEEAIHNVNQSKKFGYDNGNQLTEYKNGLLSGGNISSPIHHIQYNYDSLGNRTSVIRDGQTFTYVHNNMNAYSSVTGPYGIKNFTYDANGNMTNDSAHNYSYDIKNRITSVDNSQAAYKYDPFGRRIKKILPGSTAEYFYSGQDLIEERDSNGIVRSSNVFGKGIDNILFSERNGKDFYFVKKSLGSVVAALDSAGNVAERYDYYPNGETDVFDSAYNALTASAIGNSFLFTGREFDTESGNYFFRARSLNSELGRFTQMDPMLFIDGPNNYSYVNNNGVNFRDPLGLYSDIDDYNSGFDNFNGMNSEPIDYNLQDFKPRAIFSDDSGMDKMSNTEEIIFKLMSELEKSKIANWKRFGDYGGKASDLTSYAQMMSNIATSDSKVEGVFTEGGGLATKLACELVLSPANIAKLFSYLVRIGSMSNPAAFGISIVLSTAASSAAQDYGREMARKIWEWDNYIYMKNKAKQKIDFDDTIITGDPTPWSIAPDEENSVESDSQCETPVE